MRVHPCRNAYTRQPGSPLVGGNGRPRASCSAVRCATRLGVVVLRGAALGAAFLVVTSPSFAQGEAANPAATLFEKQCYSCHNIGGGDKKGPDLKGLGQRRTREWLHRYIPTPKALKDAGDPTAVQLFKKYAPEEMPDQMLSPEQIDQVLALIDQLTAQGKTFIPQGGRLARPPQPQDIPAGYRLFTGETRMKNGGPPCISCHSVQGVGALGGGSLGPDLTLANKRYTDVELASILKAPAFPTMSKVMLNHDLTDTEIVQLFAYLQAAKNRTPDPARTAALTIALCILGVLAALGLMGYLWRARLRGVRIPLVEASKQKVLSRKRTADSHD